MKRQKTRREFEIETDMYFVLSVICLLAVTLIAVIIYLDVKNDNLKTQLSECQDEVPIEVEVLKSMTLELNNTNYISGLWVIEYLCDENVYAVNIQHTEEEDGWEQHHFYASTWRDGIIPHSIGKCFIKYKE